VKGEKIKETRPHRQLDVWKKSLLFAKKVYLVTSKYPPAEIYGLVSQMRRATISVPSNLAEGAARRSKKEFLHFINIAQGSLSELDTQIELSIMLNYVSKEAYDELMEELKTISKMLFGLSRSLK
jgi:four helix bundle protein